MVAGRQEEMEAGQKQPHVGQATQRHYRDIGNRTAVVYLNGHGSIAAHRRHVPILGGSECCERLLRAAELGLQVFPWRGPRSTHADSGLTKRAVAVEMSPGSTPPRRPKGPA